MSFLDCVLQTSIVLHDTRSLFVPTEIQKLTIDIRQHIIYLQSLDENAEQGEFQTCTFVHLAEKVSNSLASNLL